MMARGRGGWGELGRRGLVWVYIGWDMTENKKETREEMRSDKGQKTKRVQMIACLVTTKLPSHRHPWNICVFQLGDGEGERETSTFSRRFSHE